uniref:DBF4-type domain-containing protein n=1 Tax=Strongyloides venezuelensis TaxID=75913 RepID=A0A0K0FC68_STRVS
MAKTKTCLNNTPARHNLPKNYSDITPNYVKSSIHKLDNRIRDKENIKTTLTSRSSSVVSLSSPKAYNIHPPFKKDFSLLKGKYVFVEIRSSSTRGKIMRSIEICGGIPLTSPDSKIPFAFAVSDNPVLYKVKREDYKKSTEHVLKFCDRLNLCVYSASYLYSYFKELAQLKKSKESDYKLPLPKTNIPISLRGYYIKIQHYKNPSAPFVKFCEKSDNFLKMYMGDSAGRSAFHAISTEENKKKQDRKKGISHSREKKLKLDGYCEFCNIRVPDRFNHCQMDIHRRAINDRSSDFKDLDKYLGFFDEDFMLTFKHPNVKKNIIKAHHSINKGKYSKEQDIDDNLSQKYLETRYKVEKLPDVGNKELVQEILNSYK